MNVRAATAQDAAGVVALHKSANPYGDWYRDPVQRLGPVAYEDLTPLERYLHGGFWMDLSLFRRHFHEYQRRGFPVLVAEERGHLVGECEVWLDEEPPPFGRYAEVAVVASGSPPNADVERDLVTRAAERARKLGYGAIDLSPGHSGGGRVAEGLGFVPLWDTRTYEAKVADVPRSEEEFTTRFLAGEFDALRELQPLNHREPARWRFETLAALWPAAQVAGLQDATRLVAVTVTPASGKEFAVLAARRAWLDPPKAEIDVSLHPAEFGNRAKVRRAYAIAAEIARKLGASHLETYGPESAAKGLKALGFAGGDTPDLWLRWTF